MRALLLLSTLLLGLTTVAQREPRQRRTATVGGGLEVGIPRGAFNDSLDKNIVGFSANFTIPMRLLPFDLGFDYSYGTLASESQEVEIQEEALTATTGDLSIRSTVMGYHGLLRFKPLNGKVMPYIEGMAGARHFATRTSIEVEGLDEPLREERNETALSWSTGWAVGLQIAPSRAFYMEGRVERLTGSEVSYVDPRSLAITGDGTISYDTRSSRTHVLNIHLGIGLRF